MKKHLSEGKLELDKFTISKINNQGAIFGGDAGENDDTNGSVKDVMDILTISK